MLVYCACADPLYKGMELPQICSSSGGFVGVVNFFNNNILRVRLILAPSRQNWTLTVT